MNKILIFAIALALIYLGLFFVPDRVEKFALSPEKINEVWRFVTYQFVHLDAKHLIENTIGLGLIAFAAKELKTDFSDFSSTYLSSGMLSVIPLWLAISFIALGASNAIFGGFGLISQEIKKYGIKSSLIIAILIIVTFLNSSLAAGGEESIKAFNQSLAHISGLVFGIGFFFLLRWIKPILTKKKRRILRSSAD